MRWIGLSTLPWNPDAGQSLPLAAFDRACLFFSVATPALDGANIRWRVAFSNPWAVAAADLA